MGYFNINLSGPVSIITVSLDCEDMFIGVFKKRLLIEFLQAIKTPIDRYSDDGKLYKCMEYRVTMDKEDQEDIWDACRKAFTQHIEKSLPQISQS